MSKNILIVDDSTAIRSIVKLVLTKAGYNVHEAIDGQVGLEKVVEVSPVLVICDLNMPVLNGLDFLKELKQSVQYQSHASTPVVMLTTESHEEIKQKGQELGARAWLVKPFEYDTLLYVVNKILEPDVVSK